MKNTEMSSMQEEDQIFHLTWEIRGHLISQHSSSLKCIQTSQENTLPHQLRPKPNNIYNKRREDKRSETKLLNKMQKTDDTQERYNKALYMHNQRIYIKVIILNCIFSVLNWLDKFNGVTGFRLWNLKVKSIDKGVEDWMN